MREACRTAGHEQIHAKNARRLWDEWDEAEAFPSVSACTGLTYAIRSHTSLSCLICMIHDTSLSLSLYLTTCFASSPARPAPPRLPCATARHWPFGSRTQAASAPRSPLAAPPRGGGHAPLRCCCWTRGWARHAFVTTTAWARRSPRRPRRSRARGRSSSRPRWTRGRP